jgi:OmpA-OmpF porin, OOP family
MKRCHVALLFISGMFIMTNPAFGQENNYITSKYDFIPGEKVIFFDDFTSENIGDFPAQWLTNGSGEIVTSQKFPGRWFNITKMGYYIPEAKEDFTENFTIEFDLVPMTTDNGENLYSFTFYILTGSLTEPGGGGEPGDAGFQVYSDGESLGWKNFSLANEQRFNGNVTFPFKTSQNYHIAIWVQKQRVRLYANEAKILDVPRGIPAGSKPNIFRFDTRDEAIPLIGNFRIAAGMSDMRNMLQKNGKIISYGILFDVNSDKLKPESFATLKVIADILKEDPSLKLLIVGHTDSDGDDASNLDLSKRRAASVRNELVSKFGADGARLETDGKGESEPVADNNSSVNKAKNRRVEFIDLKKAQNMTSSVKVAAGSVLAAITDTEGNKYRTVTIGTQTWMAENLKSTRFSDGTPIPLVSDSARWGTLQTPAFCWLLNNETKYKNTYGALYNFYAVKTYNLCPTGWHVPSNADWSLLATFLEDNGNAGGKLKEQGTDHWNTPNTAATNATGFTALPGSGRDNSGEFGSMFIDVAGKEGAWWTTSADTIHQTPPTNDPIINGVTRGLKFDSEGLWEGSYPFEFGLSVRCVKD